MLKQEHFYVFIYAYKIPSTYKPTRSGQMVAHPESLGFPLKNTQLDS